MTEAVQHVPYHSQWECRELTLAILSEGAEAALLRDPAWRGSGVRTVEEYARWAGHACGMACLKMILAAGTGTAVPTLELARLCTEYGGYVVNPENGAIKGMIYAPFVTFIGERFGIKGEVVTGVTASYLPALMRRSQFFMASVHHTIRKRGLMAVLRV